MKVGAGVRIIIVVLYVGTAYVKCNQTSKSTSNQLTQEFASNNITTIINLTINTTHDDDIPTEANNTGNKNIRTYSNKTMKRDSGPCCSVVRPKTCRKSLDGSKCRHRRHTSCGGQCKSHTMHTKVKRKCRAPNECSRQTVYIPEPIIPPQCISIYRWPYTLCGIYPQSSNCDGCYDDFEYSGYGNRGCYGCFDDGFEYGPLYRRGPVLRPFYYHTPPCELTGTCYSYIPFTLEGEYSRFNTFNIDQLDNEDYEGSGGWSQNTSKCQEINGEIILRNCSKPIIHFDKELPTNIRQPRKPKRHRRLQPRVRAMDPTAMYMTPHQFVEEDRPDYVKFVDDDDNNNMNYELRPNKYDRKHRFRRNRFPIDEEDLIPVEEDIF